MEAKPPDSQDSLVMPPVISTPNSIASPSIAAAAPQSTTSVVATAVQQEKEGKKEDSEDEDNNEILEESPCGRWQKRREQVIFAVILRCIMRMRIQFVFR